MKRKIILPILIVLLILAPVGTKLGLSKGLAAEKLKFGTSLKVSPLYAVPILAAEEKGFWSQQGLEVEWVPFNSSGAMYRAAAAGSLEVGMAEPVTGVQAIAQGVPIVIVAVLPLRNHFFFWVLPDSPIKGSKDLKGLKIGVSGLGGTAHAFGRAAAKAMGLEKEIRFVAAGGTLEKQAALKVGAVGAIIESFITLADLKYKGQVRDVASVADFLSQEWRDTQIYARKEFVKQRPEIVRKVVKAFFNSVDFMLDNREWTVGKMKSHSGYSEPTAEGVYAFLVQQRAPVGTTIDKKTLSNVRDFLVEYGIIPNEKAPSIDSIYIEGFAR